MLRARSLRPRPQRHHASARRPRSSVIVAGGLFDALRQLTPPQQQQNYWDQDKGSWKELQTQQQWQQEVTTGDKLVILDWFSPTCKGCEASFPQLCDLARDPEMKRSFKFLKANIENPELKGVAQLQGIKSLPCVTVYRPSVGQLISIEIPVSRVKFLKLNLKVILLNPDCDYRLDPNNFVVPMAAQKGGPRLPLLPVLPVPLQTRAGSLASADAADDDGGCDEESCSSLDW